MSRAIHTPERKALEAEILKKYFSKAKVLQKNLTRGKLALEMGVSASVYSQWVAGFTRIPDRHWLYLAKRLGFNALEFRPELASAYTGLAGLDLAMQISRLTPKKKLLLIAYLAMLEGLDIE